MNRKKAALQFLAVYLTPYVLVSLLMIDKGVIKAFGTLLLMIALGAFGAVKLLFFSAAAIHTIGFKLLLVCVSLSAIAMFIFGIKNRKQLWGKVLNSAGFYIWCVAGFVALAPSA